MTHIPIRGLFQLTRTVVVVAGLAALPYVLKKNKKLADQLGDALKKAGDRLKDDTARPEPQATVAKDSTEEAPAAPPIQEAVTTDSQAPKTTAKKTTVKKSTAKPAAKKTVVKSAAKEPEKKAPAKTKKSTSTRSKG